MIVTVLKGKSSLVNGQKIYLLSYHPLGCRLNADNIYLKRSENFALGIVKTSSPHTPFTYKQLTSTLISLLCIVSCMSVHATQASLQRHLPCFSLHWTIWQPPVSILSGRCSLSNTLTIKQWQKGVLKLNLRLPRCINTCKWCMHVTS